MVILCLIEKKIIMNMIQKIKKDNIERIVIIKKNNKIEKVVIFNKKYQKGFAIEICDMCNKIDTIVMGHSCSDCTDKYFEKQYKL